MDSEQVLINIFNAFMKTLCGNVSDLYVCPVTGSFLLHVFLLFSWDDSSSVSSGLSDTLDNISTDDLNTTSSISSYSNITVPSRKNTQVRAILPLLSICS